MAKVFISYSRKDIDFAKRLTGELQKSELDFWIDWEGIPPTVDWWREIEKGIEEADIFIFLISPDSIKSKICGEEIDTAQKNGKRLIPIVVHDIKGDETPRQLSHINWIFFRKNDNFNDSLEKLLVAIHTDYDWVQTHRRLQVKALEWERNNKENSFLLRGKDLEDAEFQLATNTSKEPHPTDLQREHVHSSRQAANRQRRITTGISIAGIIAMAVLAGLAIAQAGKANRNADESKRNEAAAQVASTLAVANEQKAQAASRLAFNNAETAVANAYAASTSQADAVNSAYWAATSQAIAENALFRVQSVAGYRAQALASISKTMGERNSPLAVLLALEAYQTTGNTQTTTRMFELLQQDLVVNQFESRDGVYVVKFDPQGDQLAVGYNNSRGDFKIWQISSSPVKSGPLQGHTRPVYALDFSPDGRILASGAFDDTVILWDTQTKQPLGRPLEGHDDWVYSVVFSPDGKYLVSGSADDKIIVWDAASRKQLTQLNGHTDKVFSLAFSPDGKTLVSGGRDKALIFWDMESFQMIGDPIKRHSDFIFSVAFSPDGKTVATADQGGAIFLWDAETRTTIGKALRGHEKEISSLAFSPDSNWLVSGGYDNQVILWDVATQQLLAKLPIADKTSVYSVAFSPDGTLLATGNKSGTVTLWNVTPGFWLEHACELAGRNFTLAEWTQYFPGEDYRQTCPQWPMGQ